MRLYLIRTLSAAMVVGAVCRPSVEGPCVAPPVGGGRPCVVGGSPRPTAVCGCRCYGRRLFADAVVTAEGDHVWMPLLRRRATMCEGRCYGGGRPCVKGVVTADGCLRMPLLRRRPNGSRRPATAATMLVVGWFASRARLTCRCLGFGGFPTLSLWTTQVGGNKFCEGIVNRGRDCVKEL